MGKKRGAKRKSGAGNTGTKSAGRRYSVKGTVGGKEPEEEQAVATAHPGKFKPIKRRRRKRLKLGEALRKVGLDEQTVAETYVGVVEVLREQTTREPGRKLLVDVLKECSRVLEPLRVAGANSNEPVTIVEMHHEMSRPERERQYENETDAGESDEVQLD